MSLGARFLRDPARSLAAEGREPFGDGEVTLRLAGRTFRFVGLDDAQCAAVDGRFGGFRAPAGTREDSTVRVLRASRDEFSDFDTRGWEYEFDFAYEPSALAWVGLELAGRLALDGPPSGAVFTHEDSGEGLLGVVENTLRIAVAYDLLAAGGALLHGAAVVDGDGAAVFVGHSGAGKSTLSGLAAGEGKSILTDDLVALLPSPDGTVVAGLPLGGDFRTRVPGIALPLRALALIEKGESVQFEPLGAARALGPCFACCPFVNHDPYRGERALDNLAALLAGIRVGTLRFARTGPLWTELVREGLT
jgi:hypothetical protein